MKKYVKPFVAYSHICAPIIAVGVLCMCAVAGYLQEQKKLNDISEKLEKPIDETSRDIEIDLSEIIVKRFAL